MKLSALQRSLLGFIAAACIAVLAIPAGAQSTSSVPLPGYRTLTPVKLLGVIRRVYRSRRPPPSYETYTLVRVEMANYGPSPTSAKYVDLANSYTKKYWIRNVDRAALTRLIYRDDAEGDLNFDRPALNEDRDPGPATADLFEPAPLHPHPVSWVPTPEPSAEPLKTIGSVVAVGESEYDVPKVTVEGSMLHLWLQPRRDPERNVLREIWVDKTSYILRKVIAHDRLFVEGDPPPYPVTFTYTLGYLNGYLVITHLHGVVEPRIQNGQEVTFEYGGDVDYDFKDIQFPSSLPDWYFNPRAYAQHVAEAPN